MSSTKIVIIVLVVIGLLFAIFVARGALRDESDSKSDEQTAKKTKAPGWTATIESLSSSLKPKLKLKHQFYTAETTESETVPADNKQAFRTAKFRLLSGSADITYLDKTPIDPSSRLSKDMKKPQVCSLPDPDLSDRNRCTILAFKMGGTLNFACTKNSSCKVEVE